MRNWSNEEIERYLGTFSSCHLSHSTEEATRNGAASGGTTSQLAIDMLEAGYVDGVLVWRLILGEDSPRTEARIATTRQEILDAQTSLYSSVSWPRDALPPSGTSSTGRKWQWPRSVNARIHPRVRAVNRRSR